MKKINWDTIEGLDAWQGTLESLLEQAKVASADNDQNELLAISNALNTFVKKSFPNSPEIMALDDVAVVASQAMSEQVADTAVMQITARTTQLTALAKQLDHLASVAADEASTLRLTKAHAAVDALTDAVRTVDGLEGAFADASDDELRGKIKDLASSMRKMRDLLEKKARSDR